MCEVKIEVMLALSVAGLSIGSLLGCGAGVEATTPLEKLLKQHHDLGEDLMDVVAEYLTYND